MFLLLIIKRGGERMYKNIKSVYRVEIEKSVLFIW